MCGSIRSLLFDKWQLHRPYKTEVFLVLEAIKKHDFDSLGPCSMQFLRAYLVDIDLNELKRLIEKMDRSSLIEYREESNGSNKIRLTDAGRQCLENDQSSLKTTVHLLEATLKNNFSTIIALTSLAVSIITIWKK